MSQSNSDRHILLCLIRSKTDKALEINPEKLDLHLLKVKIYEEQGETEKAKAARRIFQREKKEKETIDSLQVETPVRKANN